MNDRTPYTYRICWSKTGVNYYGVRYAKGCHPSDLFVTYFTSSKYVANYIEENGPPDVIEVRKMFISDEGIRLAILWENRVLKRLGVVGRSDYLNMRDGKAVDISDPRVKAKMLEAVRSDEHRSLVSKNSKRNWKNEDYRQRMVAFIREVQKRPEVKKQKSINSKKAMNEPGAKLRSSEAFSRQWDDPEFRKKNLERLRGGSTHPSYSQQVYMFTHHDGDIEVCTSYDFRMKYTQLRQQGVSKLTTGKVKIYKGWKCQPVNDQPC